MRKTVSPEVAANIRAELARQRLRQQDLADALGLNQSNLSRRLSGSLAFDVDELASVAAFLKVDVASLLPATEAVVG